MATLLSTRGLPVGASVDRLLDVAAGLPTGPAVVPPAQELVDAMLRRRPDRVAGAGRDHRA